MFALFPAVMVEQAVVVKHKAPSHSFSFAQDPSTTSCSDAYNSGTGTATCTLSSTSAGQSGILVCSDGAAPSSYSPSPTYSLTQNSGNVYIYNPLPTSTVSITITFSNIYIHSVCYLWVVKGVATSSALDQSTGMNGTGYGSSPFTLGSVTTSNAVDVILGFWNYFSTGGTTTAGSGYTLAPGITGATNYAGMEYISTITSSSGTYAPTLGTTSTGQSFPGGVFALKLQ